MIAALAEHYSWEFDFWRRMGWREFRRWARITNESKERRAHGNVTAPDTWAGRDNDPFWNRPRGR